MFKLVTTDIVNDEKDYTFKGLFTTHFKDAFTYDENIINILDALYKQKFFVRNEANNEVYTSCQLAFITNFRYNGTKSNTCDFLIGIYPDGTAGIICRIADYSKKDLLYPISKDIDFLCNNTTIMKNTELYYSRECGSDSNRSTPLYKFETKLVLLVPDNTNFKFTFDILDDICYGCECYDSTDENFDKDDILSTLEENVSIINKKLYSTCGSCAIGDYLIGVNDHLNKVRRNIDPTEFSFYINKFGD